MKKRDSRRRWKARFAARKWVPMKAVVEHSLGPWIEKHWFRVLYAVNLDEVRRP